MESSLDPRVEKLLASAEWQLDPRGYLMVGLEPNGLESILPLLQGDGFRALVVDDLESTVFLPADAWHAAGFGGALTTAVRLLTFPLVLPSDLVGFLATVTAALARAGVSVLPLAAHRRDHIFVPAPQADATISALRRLATQARS